MRSVQSIGGFLAIALVAAVLAAVAPRGASAESSDLRKFQGEVVKVEAAKHLLVIKRGGEGKDAEARYQFVVRDDAEILARGKPAKLAQIAVGDRITVSYAESRGMELVSRIETQPPVPAGSHLPNRPGFLPPQRP